MKVVHYIFSTYKRKQVLVGYIADELSLIFNQICQEKGFEMLCHSVLLEHVHLLIKKNDFDSNEYVMKMIKGISSRKIFEKYPSNRFEFRKLWGRGYRAEDVKDKESIEKVIAYINGQKINGIDKRMAPSWKPRRLGIVNK